jgi:hypothetical protein
VAHSQEEKHILDVLTVLMARVIQMLIELRVLKINVLYQLKSQMRIPLKHLLLVISAALPIGVETHRELLEIHYILCQCACLVCEQITQRTKLLIEVAALHLSWHIFLLVIQAHIPLHEISLHQFHTFICCLHGNGNKVSKYEDPSTKPSERVLKPTPLIQIILRIEF